MSTSIQGIISGVADGYTLFPSQEPTIMTSFSTPKPTATATVTSPATATATSISAASAAAAIQDIQWASQCHTSSGLDTSPCELMMAYQILGCLIGAALILEGTISWYINMQEESVEQRLKRLQAKDDAKALKLAKRTKRVQRELQALDNYKRPVIQGPMIG
ncbi:hypothetical protein BGZ46_009315 [Entomortierella lignicola]|nr:hypothetical protein BGZ46_009315 [Entomortierella lignicola]